MARHFDDPDRKHDIAVFSGLASLLRLCGLQNLDADDARDACRLGLTLSGSSRVAECIGSLGGFPLASSVKVVAPPGGLEPPTVRLEVGYSIQLNYEGAGAVVYPPGRPCQDEVGLGMPTSYSFLVLLTYTHTR